MKNVNNPVILVSVYLLVYIMVCQLDVSKWWAAVMFTLSPFLVIWMVYSSLKNGKYDGPEFSPEQEFGYQDQPMGFRKDQVAGDSASLNR
jgi:hypothetical protein